MSTLYDLFKVSENASQEEIKKAFDKIIEELSLLPQDDETINRVRRLKIAYSILSSSEKRKKYDLDLAEKRADELITKIETNSSVIENKEEIFEEDYNDKKEEKEYNSTNNTVRKKSQISQIKEKFDEKKRVKNLNSENERISQVPKKNVSNTEELKLQKKQYIRRLREEKRLERKERQLKREMEIHAYGKYLEEQGYKVKYPWTWPRIKKLIITIFAIIICSIIAWHIPFVNRFLENLYNNNFFIKKIVDLFLLMLEGLFDGIKEMVIK